MRWFMVMALACVAAGPATKPTRPDFLSPKDLVAKIPRSVLPEPSRPWDDIAEANLGRWLRDNAVGKTLRIKFKLGQIGHDNSGLVPSTFAGSESINKDGRDFRVVAFVMFAAGTENWLEKQKGDAVVEVTGHLIQAELQGHGSPTLVITIADADPRK
jgi:hypothetical protein